MPLLTLGRSSFNKHSASNSSISLPQSKASTRRTTLPLWLLSSNLSWLTVHTTCLLAFRWSLARWRASTPVTSVNQGFEAGDQYNPGEFSVSLHQYMTASHRSVQNRTFSMVQGTTIGDLLDAAIGIKMHHYAFLPEGRWKGRGDFIYIIFLPASERILTW